MMFKLDSLNSFICAGIALFSVLTVVYSSRFLKGSLLRSGKYYTYIILTAAASLAAALSNNLILLLAFWGFLGLTLYLLINMGKGLAAGEAAKKALIIVGGTDCLMIFGAAVIYYLSGTFQLDKIRLELNNGLAVGAYLCIAAACFAKAGAMPFHSWVPACAKEAPLPVAAFLPASVDKLLGIYLLARISLDLFVMNTALNLLLMAIGALTIVAAVMLALVQHNMKLLLGYHAVSQVGYMILGIGTGTPIGIAGGLFHMLNNAVYKSCLFFTAGNLEYSAKTSELDELGGLARLMPLTYISCLIASLSISGVPPFNGFVSKWMVYQGLISRLQAPGSGLQAGVLILCLVAAMFGSALTLASFIKLLHGAFLGQAGAGLGQQRQTIKEVPWQMWGPCVILALLCVLFGVFAYQLPLRYLIAPAAGGRLVFIGSWNAGLSTALAAFGFILGIYLSRLRIIRPKIRLDEAFIGGEAVAAENRVRGTEFYNTVMDFKLLKVFYKKAEAGAFDIYEQGKGLVFGVGRALQFLHNGVLPTYLVWALLGMSGLLLVLAR